MALASLLPYLKGKNDVAKKRSDGALQKYPSADPRIWSNDVIQKSMGLYDVLTTKKSIAGDQVVTRNSIINSESLSKDELNKTIENFIREIKQKDEELDKIHKLYLATSSKLKSFDEKSKNNQNFKVELKDCQIQVDQIRKEEEKHINNELKDSKNTEAIEKDWESVKERAEKYEQILKERDYLKDQLCKVAGIKNLLKKLKIRADEADTMEREIFKLKGELKKSHSNKNHIEGVTRVASEALCSQCEKYDIELKKNKSMLLHEEKKCTELKAEMSFLQERNRIIKVMEAELFLFKRKYDECQDQLSCLKEVILKNENAADELKESQSKLKLMEGQLHEAEEQNQNLINIIEKLDTDLKEREIFINSTKNRQSSEEHVNLMSKSFNFNETISVFSMAQKFNEPTIDLRCDSSAEICERNETAMTSFIETPTNVQDLTNSFEPVIENFTDNLRQKSVKIVTAKKSNSQLNDDNDEFKKNSELIKLQVDASINEVNLLRKQNHLLHDELSQLQKKISEMTQMISDLEMQRSSNSKMEYELDEMQTNYSKELERINLSFQNAIAEKTIELEEIEKKLTAEYKSRDKLKEKIEQLFDELNDMRKSRTESEELKNSLKVSCEKEHAYLEELKALKIKIEENQRENLELKAYQENLKNELQNQKTKQNNSSSQRDEIKKTIMDFRRRYEEKVLLINCYEKKIRTLEAENKSLKCFCDKFLLDPGDASENAFNNNQRNGRIESLDFSELTELYNRVRSAMINNIDARTNGDINLKYSKTFDRLCKNFNVLNYMAKTKRSKPKNKRSRYSDVVKKGKL